MSYNTIVLVAVALGSMSYGINFAVISSAIGLPAYVDYFGINVAVDPHYAHQIDGALTGVFFGAGFFGSFGFAWFADRYGRRAALVVAALFGIVSGVIQATSINIGMHLAGRAIAGFSGGGLMVVPPIFQSEISVAEHRGKNVGLHGVLFTGGITIGQWLGFGVYFVDHAQSWPWRFLFGITSVAPALLVLSAYWLPESPRWLVLNGNDDAAFAVLSRLHSSEDNQLAQIEHIQIQEQVRLDSQHNTSWIALWKRPSTRRRLLLGIFVMYMFQCTGVNVIAQYQVNVTASVGLKDWQPLLVLAIYALLLPGLNYLGGWLMDKFGRRRLFLVGLCGCFTAVTCQTPLLMTFIGSNNKAGGSAAIAFLFVYIFFFAPCIDVVTFVYGAEIFPNYMRGRGFACVIGTYFAISTLFLTTSAASATTAGPRFNFVFIATTLVNILVVYKFLPETKGLSLEEMGRLFGEEDHVEHFDAHELSHLDLNRKHAIVSVQVENVVA